MPRQYSRDDRGRPKPPPKKEPRYAKMGRRVMELNRNQIQRRLGAAARAAGKRPITAPAHLPPVPVKRVLKPVVVPERLGDDPGYIARHFPRAAKARELKAEFAGDKRELSRRKVQLITELNAVNAEVGRQQHKLEDLQRRHKQLLFQDNIMEERDTMTARIKHEEEKEINKRKQIAKLQRYSKVLLRMKARLWKEQSVFQRTMETYQTAMAAQNEESKEIRDTYRRVQYWKKVTEKKLRQLKEGVAEKIAETQMKVDDLQDMVTERENVWENMEKEKEEKVEEEKHHQKTAKAEDVAQHITNMATRTKISDMNEQVEIHQEAFRKIRLVTGLTQEQEIIDRFKHQREYLKEMDDKIVFLRSQVAQATKHQQQMKERREKEKYAGKGSEQKNKKSQIEKLQAKLDMLRAEKVYAKTNYLKYNKMLIAFGQSVDHAHNALQWVKVRARHRPKVDEDDEGDDDSPPDAATELLRRMDAIDRKMTKMLNAILPTKPNRKNENQQQSDMIKNTMSHLIESMVFDNNNNVRVLPEAERQARFLSDAIPKKRRKNKNSDEEAEKEAAYRAKQEEARLRRIAIRTGKSLEDVKAQQEIIPNVQRHEVMDRKALKKLASGCERRARKLEKKEKRAAKLPKIKSGGGSQARSQRASIL